MPVGMMEHGSNTKKTIGDMKKYLVYEKGSEDIFSSIIEKYFNKWQKNNLEETINKNQLSTDN